MARILITGASGFIGYQLVTALAARGEEVVALSRCGRLTHYPAADSKTSALGGIKVVKGDVGDLASLTSAMAGCQQVYHLAGYAKNWSRNPSIYYQVNALGLHSVLQAARQLDVERVVWASTCLTFEPSQRGRISDESTPRTTPYFTHYERSKAAAEKIANDFAQQLPIVTVNPGRVFGPGHLTEGNSVTKVLDEYERGQSRLLPHGGRNIANYVYVMDVVHGMQLAMERGVPGQRYMLGGPNLSLNELVDVVVSVTGKRYRQLSVGSSVLMAYAYLQQKRAEWFGVHPLITPPWVRVFSCDWACSTAKAQKELGYEFTPASQAIAETFQWLQRARRLDASKDLSAGETLAAPV